jgi:hypothetical protein
MGFLPFVGLLVNALALALGLGAILLTVVQFQLREQPRRQFAPVTLPAAPEDARQIPPPPIGQQPGTGMENLPEGFRWWGDNKD